MTTELERIKILEGKISQVVDYVQRLSGENDKLKQQLKDLKGEKARLEDQSKRIAKLDEETKRHESEREAVKARIEAIIGEIDKIGI